MADNLHRSDASGRRPLSKRWWLTPVIFLGVLILLGLTLFLVQVLQFRDQINRGVIPEEFADRLTTAPGLASNSSASQAIQNVATTDDPFMGEPDAPVVIVGFEDFQCPFCLQAFPIIREVMTKNQGEIKFIYRDFPIVAIHPESAQAALAAECADEQGKFWEYHDKLFINQSDLSAVGLNNYANQVGLNLASFNQCLNDDEYKEEVQQDFDDGVAAGVSGTPTWFVNGKMIAGVLPLEVWQQIIEAEIKASEQ
jgi:protein-disulfide isomerase